MQINQPFSKFILFAVSPFILLISTVKILSAITPDATEKSSLLLVELSRDDLRICAQQNESLVESFYIETANFFANICQKTDSTLLYIGGEKVHPENAIQIPAIAEEGTGYVAEDGDITYIVTGATFSIVKNAKTINEEQVIYVCSQFSKKICQEN